jgi:hypothetical protein
MSGSIKKQWFSVIVILFVSTAVLFGGDVIQTQEAHAWDGIEVDITKITFKNNILTIKLKFRNTGTERKWVTIFYKDCYIMDEVNQKKYYLLKGSDGIYIAGPQISDSIFAYHISPNKSKNVWLKFPEPTDNPKSIIISIPGVELFEEVEIKK